MKKSSTTDARRLIRPLIGKLRRLLQELVRTNSVTTLAGGKETPAQRVLQQFFREQGLRPELYDTAFILKSKFPDVRRHKSYAGRKNLAVRLSGAGRGKSLLLNGHIDTVPPGNGSWSHSPWSGRFYKGHVLGLGSFDMKGGLVANAAVVSALHRAGVRPGGDILFESVVDEEWGGGGGTIAARLRGDRADACVIPEGTQLQIYRGTRGGFVVDLVVQAGDPTAYFSDAEVISPALPLGRLLGWVAALTEQRRNLAAHGAYEGFPDPAPVQVLAVEANRTDPQVPLSVPSQGTVRVYMQFLPHEDVDAVIRQTRTDLETFAASDPFFCKYPIQWVPLIGGPLYGQEVESGHPWLQCMEESAAHVFGKPAVTTAAPYPCDAGLIHRSFGIPTLLFGPSGSGAHNPDESVDFDSVIRSAEVLLTAAMAWTNA